MVLTEKEIREYALLPQNPLIVPFHEAQLQGASYDIRLSDQIAVFKKGTQTIDAEDCNLHTMYEKHTLKKDGYILEPNEYVFVQIQEKLNLPENWIAHIRPRTRFTRLGLLVADQHCNPTYSGQLFLGLFNASPNAIRIKKDVAIAQIVFEQLSGTPRQDKLYRSKEDAAYMNEDNFRGSVPGEKGWSPELEKEYNRLLSLLD